MFLAVTNLPNYDLNGLTVDLFLKYPKLGIRLSFNFSAAPLHLCILFSHSIFQFSVWVTYNGGDMGKQSKSSHLFLL